MFTYVVNLLSFLLFVGVYQCKQTIENSILKDCGSGKILFRLKIQS